MYRWHVQKRLPVTFSLAVAWTNKQCFADPCPELLSGLLKKSIRLMLLSELNGLLNHDIVHVKHQCYEVHFCPLREFSQRSKPWTCRVRLLLWELKIWTSLNLILRHFKCMCSHAKASECELLLIHWMCCKCILAVCSCIKHGAFLFATQLNICQYPVPSVKLLPVRQTETVKWMLMFLLWAMYIYPKLCSGRTLLCIEQLLETMTNICFSLRFPTPLPMHH